MTETAAPRRLYEVLLADKVSDDRIALGFVEAGGPLRQWSFAALAAEAERLAAAIAEVSAARRVRGRGVVAVLSASQEAQCLHYLAALAAGLTPAILTPPTRKQDPDWYLANMQKVLEQIAPELVLTDMADALDSALAGRPQRPAVARLWSADPVTAAVGDPQPVSSEAAFVQFSSGTTGTKKGVVVSADAMCAQLDAYGHALGVEPTSATVGDRVVLGDCIVSWLPLYHDMGFVTALHLPLRFGISSIMLDPIEWVTRPVSYLQAVGRFGATLGWHPNFAYNFMAQRVRDRELDGIDLSSLRALVNCAEPVTYRSQQAFLDRFEDVGLDPTVFTGCWAMAETTFAVTHGADTQVWTERAAVAGADPTAAGPLVPVGAALPGVEVSVRDASGTEVPDGGIGELWVRAPFLAAEYFANPAATSDAFVEGWYRTGDLGFWEGGQLFVRGRSKDLLIVAGCNVFPEDVEAVLSSTSGVRPGRVAAFAQFDERMQTEKVVVLIEALGDPSGVDRVAALRRLTAGLDLSGAHIEVVPAGWLVKSSSGKISRHASAAKWRARHAPPGVDGETRVSAARVGQPAC